MKLREAIRNVSLATVLVSGAACERPDSISKQTNQAFPNKTPEASVLPVSSPLRSPEKTVDPHMFGAQDRSVQAFTSLIFDVREIFTVGVRAQQTYGKVEEINGEPGFVVDYNVGSWGINKEVQIAKIRGTILEVDHNITPAQSANGILWRARVNVSYIYRQANKSNGSLGSWSAWKDGQDPFVCTSLKPQGATEEAMGCTLADPPTPQSGYNWPAIGGLYDIVYSRP